MPAIPLILSQLKLVHFVVLGAILLIGGLLGYSQTLKTRLALCETRSEAFIADIAAKGYKQAAKNWKEIADRDKITQNLEMRNAELQNSLDSRYAAHRRMLDSTHGRGVPPIPATPESSEGGQESTESATAVYEFERRITDILERGDKAIAEAITFEDWSDQQQSLAHQ